MILGTLALNEQQTMTFGMSVFGTTQAPADIRFIIEGSSFAIVCKCTQVGEDIIVDIPPLKSILEAGEYPIKIEVIIGDKIFTPLRESVEFQPLVELDVSKKNIKVQSECVQIHVKESSSKEVKSNPIEDVIEEVKLNPIDVVISEGFEIVEINGYNVIKKDDKYFGFVSDSKVLKSPKGYNTIEKLVESLSVK